MKVLLINSVCGIGSTGRICTDLAQEYENNGDVVKIAYGRNGFVSEKYKKYAVRIGSDLGVKINALKTRIFDNEGLNAKAATKKFLKWADEYDPDLVWLHNLHGYYINYELLFDWIKSRPQMQVQWTLHDCWAFTGHCSHFSFVKCEQWKNICLHCVQKKQYPKSILKDNCKSNFEKKKRAFLGVKHMTLIAPSKWLANLVSLSFLKGYKIEVVYNNVKTDVFKPSPSNFRHKHRLENKKIVLGVANVWTERKGIDDFFKLAEILSDEFRIVLVGLSEKQLKILPKNIIGVTRTNNATELAEIYTAADVFVNPSVEETFGLTTIEALACGTPAIVYKDTACEEVAKKYGGIIIKQGDIISLKKEIIKLLNQ